MIDKVRLIKKDDLDSLLSLYEYLHLDDPDIKVDANLEKEWDDIISNPDYFYIVAEEDGQLVSTCNLTIIRNLTKQAKPFGFIENVVTHPDYRKNGYGTAVVKKAIEIAQEHNCHKLLLSTTRKDEDTMNFYKKAGFLQEEITGFIMWI